MPTRSRPRCRRRALPRPSCWRSGSYRSCSCPSKCRGASWCPVCDTVPMMLPVTTTLATSLLVRNRVAMPSCRGRYRTRRQCRRSSPHDPVYRVVRHLGAVVEGDEDAGAAEASAPAPPRVLPVTTVPVFLTRRWRPGSRSELRRGDGVVLDSVIVVRTAELAALIVLLPKPMPTASCGAVTGDVQVLERVVGRRIVRADALAPDDRARRATLVFCEGSCCGSFRRRCSRRRSSPSRRR